MPRHIIEKIQNAIKTGNYDMTFHAVEEMAEDELVIFDVEHAILTSKLLKKQRDDLRGTRYVIEGVARDNFTPMGIVGRFKETGIFLIITVYIIT